MLKYLLSIMFIFVFRVDSATKERESVKFFTFEIKNKNEEKVSIGDYYITNLNEVKKHADKDAYEKYFKWSILVPMSVGLCVAGAVFLKKEFNSILDKIQVFFGFALSSVASYFITKKQEKKYASNLFSQTVKELERDKNKKRKENKTYWVLNLEELRNARYEINSSDDLVRTTEIPLPEYRIVTEIMKLEQWKKDRKKSVNNFDFKNKIIFLNKKNEIELM